MHASAAGSLFARVYAGPHGRRPVHDAPSPTRTRTSSARGSSPGKGLYDVDAFRASVDGRVPENALLSHDLFEGLHARTALVSDVEVVDDYPARTSSRTRAGSTAGCAATGRSSRGSSRVVPTRHGFAKNRLPLISQWKILDNLRRSLVAPALLALLRRGVDGPPRRPARLHARRPRGRGVPARRLPPAVPRGSPATTSRCASTCAASSRSSRPPLAQAFLTLVLLPYHAWETVHAIGLTLVRLVVTERRLLDWETAAAQATQTAGSPLGRRRARSSWRWSRAPSRPRRSCRDVTLRPSALPLAAAVPRPLDAGAAPGLLAQPPRAVPPAGAHGRGPRAAAGRSRADVEVLRDARRAGGPRPPARTTSRRRRSPAVAHRTSPTNIGMALLSTLAAHDLGLQPRGRDAREARADARDRGEARAPRGPPPQLVRHADARAARAALRLDGRQRQPRRRARRARARAAARSRGENAALAPRLVDARPPRAAAFADGMRFGFLLHRRAAALLHRVPAGRREGPGRLDFAPTTSSPPRRASRASSRSPRATCRRATGSTSGGSS